MILCLEVQDMSRRRLICFLTALVLAVSLCASALALDSGTLKYGSRGEAVRKLQQALIDQGYLKGSADGVFGNKTENAVRAFQKAKKLKVDGLAGKKTQELLYGSSGSKTTSTSGSTSTSSSTTSSSSSASSSSTTPCASLARSSE
jgi:peptidoglycan hydrolase-like protein with peptidoglycan-binding domain